MRNPGGALWWREVVPDHPRIARIRYDQLLERYNALVAKFIRSGGDAVRGAFALQPGEFERQQAG